MTQTQKATMYAEIQKHGENLNRIFNTGIDPIKLCKKLHSLEIAAHKIAEDYCNGDIQTADIDKHTGPLLQAVHKILGDTVPVMFNGDARGYALKISDKYVREHNLTIYRDWGGYGIIAPDFSPSK